MSFLSRRSLIIGFLTGLSLVSIGPAYSQETAKPAPAQTVIDTAVKRADSSGKTTLVVFHASWCGWCKRLDKSVLNDPEMGKLLGKYFEIVHLDVMENEDKKALENPGGNEILATLGGAKSGLPFYAVLDKSGKKLADSNAMPKNGNIGYPASAEEITAFIGVLKKAAPRLTAAEEAQITAHLKKVAPKS